MVLLGPSLSLGLRPSPALESLTADFFKPHIATEFSMYPAEGKKSLLVLAKVTEKPLQRNVAQFSLIFHGAAETGIGDGIYLFRHPILGSFDLFIVPIGSPDSRRRVYQACFSRYLNTQERNHV